MFKTLKALLKSKFQEMEGEEDDDDEGEERRRLKALRRQSFSRT